jgi:hypothetical protein
MSKKLCAVLLCNFLFVVAGCKPDPVRLDYGGVPHSYDDATRSRWEQHKAKVDLQNERNGFEVYRDDD